MGIQLFTELYFKGAMQMATEKRNGNVADVVEQTTEAEKLYERVTKIVQEVGLPEHLIGFKYAQESIVGAYRSLMAHCEVTRNGLESVAEKFQTTRTDLERHIMRAVEYAWDNCIEISVAEKYFHARSIPSALEFIMMTAEYLRDEEI